MKIFEYMHYKKFIIKKINSLPGKGRGELSRMAKYLGIHTTMLSHVLKGEANFSLEQSLNVAEYFGFNELETDYLIAIIQWERSGTKMAKDFSMKKISELRCKALQLNLRLEKKNKMTESDQAFYYSNWFYSGVRLLTAIERFQTIEALADELKLPIAKVRNIMEFLVSRGLCIQDKNRFKFGDLPTYINSSSPLVTRHHLNWRQKAQEKFDLLRESDLVFTFPNITSEKVALEIREKIVLLLEEIKKQSEPSVSENLYILNIDWIKFT